MNVPGLVEQVDEHGETTVVVAPASLIEAALYLRDALGFNFLSDITAVDYLDWGSLPVSGYIGTNAGRDLNAPMTQGFQVVPLPKPKRFAMNYHLLSIGADSRRIRLHTWLDEGEPVPASEEEEVERARFELGLQRQGREMVPARDQEILAV